MRACRGSTHFGRLSAVTVVMIFLLAPLALGEESGPVGTLRVGDALFWDGDDVSATEDPLPVPVPSLLGDDQVGECRDGECLEYEIEVAERGAQLRVAIDTPDCESVFSLELVDPAGVVNAKDQSCYSAEAYVRNPAKGAWIARVVPSSSGESVFRMRAKLEGPRVAPTARRALLPNLRVEPPHQVGFHADEAGLGGSKSSGCFEDETIEDGAVRCLRFSVGPQNTGAGPLELKFSREANLGTEASMYQRVYYSDGTTEMRDAGSSEFHKTHQHFHLKGFARFELFRVTNRSEGTLVRSGMGHKSGFCLVDLRIARWRRFNQQRAYSARSNCLPVGGEAELGLSAGWTDVYGYELSGNYVDFADNPDGYYVIRTVVDSQRRILETNERDNVGYAYVDIRGSSVTLIERGQGKSPWDPNKTAFVEWWRARI